MEPTRSGPAADLSTPAVPSHGTAEETRSSRFDWPPQVIYSSPQPGEAVLLDGAITVRFDQPMARSSVEEAFAIVALEDADRAITGQFTWPRDDTFLFTPSTKLGRQQRYKVTIAATARGLNGMALTEPVALTLQTVGNIAVSQVIPAPDAAAVQIDTAITVLFNRPVVPLTATSQQASLPQPLAFEPPVTGGGQWVSTSIYRFVPAAPLAGAATYEVTIAAGLEDLVGGLLPADYQWRFTTVAPSIITTFPYDSAEAVPIESDFVIEFNMPMDPVSSEAAVSLTPAVDLLFSWRNEGRTLIITPTQILQLQTAYQLEIRAEARSQGRAGQLDRSYSINFWTMPLPAVGVTYPMAGEQVDPTFMQSFQIEFAAPVLRATIQDQIRIEPARAGDRSRYEYWSRYETTVDAITNVFITFPFQAETDYSVTIPGSVADPYGNSLGEPVVIQFRTRPHRPVVSFNLPYDHSQLSTSFPSTIEIGYRNTSTITLQLKNLGLPLRQLNTPYQYNLAEPPLSQADRTWTETVDKRNEVQALSMPLADGNTLPTGVYLIAVMADDISDSAKDFYYENSRNVLVIAGTNLVIKESFGHVYVWATDLATGEPASGLNLTFYNKQDQHLGTAITDQDGLASLEVPPPRDNWLEGILVVAGEPGESSFGVGASDWDLSAQPYWFGLPEYTYQGEPPLLDFIITDRPIYRPGDTVQFRGILRTQHYGRYGLSQHKTLELALVFNSSFYGEMLQEVRLNPMVDSRGNFSGEIVIPDDWPLGDYILRPSDPTIAGERSFTVAEYRTPEFFMTATAAEAEIRRGEPASFIVTAGYFFGGPATDLNVGWSVSVDRYYLPWQGSYYSFDDMHGATNIFLYGAGGQTGADGSLTFTILPEFLADLPDGSWVINIEATVHDISEFPVSARTSLIQHGGDVYVGITPAEYLNPIGGDAVVNLITVDPMQRPVADQAIAVTLFQVEWLAEQVERDGRLITEWKRIETEVDRAAVVSDSEGKVSHSFRPAAGGSYLVRATVVDEQGRPMTSAAYLYLLDPNFISWAGDPELRNMSLVPDQERYRVGETARILVQSPFADPVQAWLIIERGAVMEHRLIQLTSGSDILLLPLTADFAPNVYLSVVATQGTAGGERFADIRLGITNIVVEPEQLALTVTVNSDRAVYQPRETAEFVVQTTDFQGRPVSADVSLALVDLAVLSLKPDNVPPLLNTFYQQQPLRSRLGSGLFFTGEGLELDFPQAVGGYGGGNGGNYGSASFALTDHDVRRDFRDTAHWASLITTDDRGQAVISVTLPDNLTTWRMTARAITPDSLVGEATSDIIATKPLLIRPVTPRFMTVGDVIELGAIVNNNSGSPQRVTVILEAAGVAWQSPVGRIFTLPPAGSRLVRWTVTVNDVAAADLTFRVSSDEYSDASKPTLGEGPEQLIPVYRYSGEDIVGTSGMLSATGRRVEGILLPPELDERQGSVEVAISASLAVTLLEALNYNESYEFPRTCAYGYADRLQATASLLYALDELAVAEPELQTRLTALVSGDVATLAQLQLASGGWDWCSGERSDPLMSANVLLSLSLAGQAGYPTSPETLASGADYLERQLKTVRRLQQPWEINRQAYFIYVLALLGYEAAGTRAAELVEEHRDLLHPYAKAYLILALDSTSGRDAAELQSLLDDLYDSANISAAGAHWENLAPEWDNLTSDVSGTAIILHTLLQIDPEQPLLPSVVRWLIVARTVDHWPTTYETAWSIQALANWMVASGELDTAYQFSLQSNQQIVTQGRFDRSNLDETVDISLPLSQLLADEINFLTFQHLTGRGNLYYTAYLDSFIAVDQIAPVARGIHVERTYYDARCKPAIENCLPITEIRVGQQVRVELSIIAEQDLLYLLVEDYYPAGAEAIDPSLSTSSTVAEAGLVPPANYEYGYWGWWYFNRIEFRNEKVAFYSEFLPAGTYQYTYYLQTLIPGIFQVRPALARQEYFPDVFGRSDGFLFTIDRP